MSSNDIMNAEKSYNSIDSGWSRHKVSYLFAGIHTFPRTKATADQVPISLYQCRGDENPISFRTLSPKISHLSLEMVNQ